MSFFGDIPHGKNDLPQLLAMKAPEFNIEDVDGAEYMLDHRMEGCFCFVCTKKIGSMENPAVMIECGFLSNPEEAQKLENEDYQRQVAFTVLTGISEYRLMQK